MLLFVGLGNPGSAYENHRHNVGFMAVDRLVHRHNFSAGPKRWQAQTFEGRYGAEKVVVLKPQTFMNLSGQSVGEAMRFFKLEPDDVVVFYDELDLAFGKIKVKTGGGAAGHNGIRSITSHIGPEFVRVRIGIGHPGEKARVQGHVLGDFAKAEREPLDEMLDAVADQANYLAARDHPRFMTEVARQLQPQRPSSGERPTSDERSPSGERQNKAPVKKNLAAVPGSAAKATQEQSDEGPMAAALRLLKAGLHKGEK